MTPEPAHKPRRRVSPSGLRLIKSFEGLRRKSARLPGGRFVVGHGHTRSAREGVEIDEADAEALLRYDLLPVEAAVNEWSFAPLNQNQFDALVSFAFNIGLSAFRRSDVLRRVNEGALLQAAGALEMWRRVELDGEGVVVDALVRRRAAEKALFLQPIDGHVPAPSAVLKPRIDIGAYRSVPRRRPERVATPMDGDDAVAIRSEPPEQPMLDSSWSVTKAAAANVTARLTEMFADEDPLAGDADATEDPRPAPAEALDGDFLQAPPTPPEPDRRRLAEEETFPALDPDLRGDPARAVAAAAEPPPAAPEPAFTPKPAPDLAGLQPFPTDAELQPVVEPAAQAEFDSRFAPGSPDSMKGAASEVQWVRTVSADAHRRDEANAAPPSAGFDHPPVGPSQGDPGALSEPIDRPDNGPYIYLFLAGLALLVAAAVTLVRTPEPGTGYATGLGWVLGLSGIAGVLGALWAIMGREAATRDEDA